MAEPMIDLSRLWRHPATLTAMNKLLAATEDVLLGEEFRNETGMNRDEQGETAAAVARHVILVGHEIDRRIDLHLQGWRPEEESDE